MAITEYKVVKAPIRDAEFIIGALLDEGWQPLGSPVMQEPDQSVIWQAMTKGTADSGSGGGGSYTLEAATSDALGGVKLGSDTVQTVAATAVSTTAARTYAVQPTSTGQMVVNVPWADTNTVYTLPAATDAALGGVKLGSATAQSVAAATVSATAARTYAVQANASGQMVVNVPWTDNNTTYVAATSTALGLVKQGAAVADATSETDVVAQLNAALASLRAAGVLASA